MDMVDIPSGNETWLSRMFGSNFPYEQDGDFPLLEVFSTFTLLDASFQAGEV